MKTLYLECNMGAAGDMLMAALLELYDHPEEFIAQMNSLGLEGVRVTKNSAQKCGITGGRVEVTINGVEEESVDVPAGHAPHGHDHEHERHEHDDHEHDHERHDHDDHGHHHKHEHEHHRHDDHEQEHTHGHGEHGQEHHHAGMGEVSQVISGLPLSAQVRANALAVYGLIAQAESQVHGKPVQEVHFHEVGAKDAIADIVGCCLLVELLAPDEIVVSPIHVGSGQVKCAHGILPVPAPATAIILQGVPIYAGEINGELCTPTGAALLKHFATRFAPMPVMCVNKTGYGMGKKEFAAANCLRAYLGESGAGGDEVVELCCNLDDMTGEAISCAAGLLLDAGALDVFSTPIYMKKNRPATLFTCLCRPADEAEMTTCMLTHTTTLGVRKRRCTRSILQSQVHTVDTPYGKISIKTSTGHGVTKSKPEFADVETAANKHGVPFHTVWLAANSACC